MINDQNNWHNNWILMHLSEQLQKERQTINCITGLNEIVATELYNALTTSLYDLLLSMLRV
jgi:hypothetical protein